MKLAILAITMFREVLFSPTMIVTPIWKIVVSSGWFVHIIDGNGSQLTKSPSNDGPVYTTGALLLNTPAVGDLDGDGYLEMVAFSDKVYAWDLPDGAILSDWPMFKFGPARRSVVSR
ncbi:MAG: hypothetical protein IPJ88_07025 [Myxococcales bacterium]|nr:MAG: hypothetical protein IPJ88_07025 [Myxococcales bacterium]